MHGGNAFLLIFVVLLVLNVPTFIGALLGTKCSLYLFPKLKRFFIIRWVLPVIFASILWLFGVGFAFFHLDHPWPTEPVLSGWGCLGVTCIVDLGLFFLLVRLKYREYRKRRAVVTAEVVEDSTIPTAASR